MTRAATPQPSHALPDPPEDIRFEIERMFTEIDRSFERMRVYNDQLNRTKGSRPGGTLMS